jgi:hypothetical protein
VIGYQEKAHGMAVDAQDNVWITDAGQATVKKLSPDGKLLLTVGERGKRGDWIEDKGQRLLWQPVMVAFGPKGDVYIGMGHANESPNDVDSPDPANKYGVARVMQITADGKFVRQWFGNEVGQGKFNDVHGLAVDPTNGDVWIGDREQYRIVVYTADGRFKKTLLTKNLVCASAVRQTRQSLDGVGPGWPVPQAQPRRQGAGRGGQRHGHRPWPVHRSQLLGVRQEQQSGRRRHQRRPRHGDDQEVRRIIPQTKNGASQEAPFLFCPRAVRSAQ